VACLQGRPTRPGPNQFLFDCLVFFFVKNKNFTIDNIINFYYRILLSTIIILIFHMTGQILPNSYKHTNTLQNKTGGI
jgi:hypothetical protein